MLEEYRTRFPNLFFLFDNARRMIPASDTLQSVFYSIERELRTCVEATDNGKAVPDTVVGKWYKGEYAQGFYYNLENNERFENYTRALCYEPDHARRQEYFLPEGNDNLEDVLEFDSVDRETGYCKLYSSYGVPTIVHSSELSDYKNVTAEVNLKEINKGIEKGRSLKMVASDLAEANGYDLGSYEVSEANGTRWIEFYGETDSSVGQYIRGTLLTCKEEDIKRNPERSNDRARDVKCKEKDNER